jgi:hypothetical protein
VTACFVALVQRAAERATAGDRAREQQVPGALLQRGYRRADRVGAAEDVRQHHLAPQLGSLLEEATLGAESRVGEDDVDLAEGVERRLDHRLLLGEVRDVARHRDRALAAAELVRQLLQRARRASGEDEPVALLRGAAGGRGADAAGCSGDQEDPPCGGQAVVGHAVS